MKSVWLWYPFVGINFQSYTQVVENKNLIFQKILFPLQTTTYKNPSIKKRPNFQSNTQVEPIMGGDCKLIVFWSRANTYQKSFQNSRLSCQAAIISPAAVSPAPLRLHLQKNPVDTRQIRNRRPGRLPPHRKVQMVPHKKPDQFIRRPLATTPRQRPQKENMDAPPGHSYPKTHGLRPH